MLLDGLRALGIVMLVVVFLVLITYEGFPPRDWPVGKRRKAKRCGSG